MGWQLAMVCDECGEQEVPPYVNLNDIAGIRLLIRRDSDWTLKRGDRMVCPDCQEKQ